MKVALLAGGLGTRLREETEFRPKPMVPIGGKPILWHIMRNYAHYGHQDFVICTGYRGDVIRQYFKDFQAMNLDFTIKIGLQSVISMHGKLEEQDWSVTVADTGAETMTGGRIFKIRDYLGSETFMCTYGDGVANVDIRKLLEFHKSHGKIATMTAVKPVSRFGVVEIADNGGVEHFKEKPQTDGWVNAGFFVFESGIFDYLSENSVLENEPLTELAKQNELHAFRHEGFWQPMDTYRETLMLNEMWSQDAAPWKVW